MEVLVSKGCINIIKKIFVNNFALIVIFYEKFDAILHLSLKLYSITIRCVQKVHPLQFQYINTVCKLTSVYYLLMSPHFSFITVCKIIYTSNFIAFCYPTNYKENI